MKNIMKRVIAVFSVVCVAAMSFVSCGDKESSSTEPEGNPTMKYPLEIGAAADGNSLTPGDPNADLDAPDPESSEEITSSESKEEDKKEPATELVKVTEADGQPATKVVKVTEADGQPATDDKGKEKTEIVEVTEVVTKPAENSEKDNPKQDDDEKSDDKKDDDKKNNDEKKDDEQSGENDESYVSAEDGRYAMWLDISKDENFYFEGEMLKAQFKVKEGIPDGDYEIRISPDLSDIAGNVVRPEKVISGVIRVNNGEIEAADVSGETGLVFYGDKISCKQGDTIDFNINVKNNSGLAAFCIWFYFDSNALEFVDAGATGEFEEIARQTEIGSGSEE